MPTNWRKNTPIAYKQGMSATRCPIVFENFHILIQGQCENTFYMSAIRGLQCKFRNNFPQLRYRGGIFAKFAVGNIGNIEWQMAVARSTR